MSCTDAVGVVLASGQHVSILWVPVLEAPSFESFRSVLQFLLEITGLEPIGQTMESTFVAPSCVQKTLLAFRSS